MKMLSILLVLLTALMITGNLQADTQNYPDPMYCTATIATEGVELFLYCTPSGNGAPATRAVDDSGNIHDASITLTLRDAAGDPMPGFPGQDINIGTAAGTLSHCYYMFFNDTDANGQVHWSGPIRTGGYSQDRSDQLCLYVNGYPIVCDPGLTLYINTPDLNGDQMVDILDITTFQALSADGYHPALDLEHDNVIDILDVTRLTTAWLEGCR